MNYAMIKEGIVVNILSIRPEQAHEFPGCVPLNDVPAIIGDTYVDGLFYREGEQVKSLIQRLSEEVEILNIILGGE